MILIPYSKNHSENLRRKGNNDNLPCALCGKEVKRPRYWVHVHNGGSHIVTEEEAAELAPAADMYFFPLGNDCYRKHPELKLYAHRIDPDGYDPADDDRFLAYQYSGE